MAGILVGGGWGTECDISIPRIPGPGELSVLLGGTGTGTRKIWFQKEIPEPVPENYSGTVTLWWGGRGWIGGWVTWWG